MSGFSYDLATFIPFRDLDACERVRRIRKREITRHHNPQFRIRVARVAPSIDIAEPLHVRALVTEYAGELVAIVQADLIGFARWHVADVREFAADRLGIRRGHVLLSATHTHSGPRVFLVRGCRMAPQTYQRFVVRQMQTALEQAFALLAEACRSTLSTERFRRCGSAP